MPVLPFTRSELRKRHPGLRIRNHSDLDHAIDCVTRSAFGHYLVNGAHETSAATNIAAALAKLDEPAKAALVDYIDRLKEVVESA